MKTTFLNHEKPLLVAMVQEETPDAAIAVILNSLQDGAEAFGIQLCILRPEYRTEAVLRKIFAACHGKPIYITSYREHYNKHFTDDECVELLLLGLRAGATILDVMGDMYCPDSRQLTFDPEAVEKQKALIATIHEMGGEVLMSTHLNSRLTEDEVMQFAYEQSARGADVLKIVDVANTEDEEFASLATIRRLKKELDKPFLYLVRGKYTRVVRQLGPVLGVCAYLCVQSYLPITTKCQPLLRSSKAVRDNMIL